MPPASRDGPELRRLKVVPEGEVTASLREDVPAGQQSAAGGGRRVERGDVAPRPAHLPL